MAPMYVMNLVEQAVDSAATQLQHISELIGR